MKRFHFLIAMLMLLLATPAIKAMEFADETLHYDIVYHWGFIWKHAASANLSIRQSGDNYDASLDARTISWADKIFKVRDTLSCSMKKDNLRPAVYKKASHEGRHSGVDIVEYAYSDGKCLAKCTRNCPNKPLRVTNLEADNQAYDMLSIFYFLRSLPFESMRTGTSVTTTIFSGTRKEQLEIRFLGVETIELRDKSKHQAFHASFSFTQDGNTKSSDDMHTWISVDSRHIPLMLKGKLAIGEVRCYYRK